MDEKMKNDIYTLFKINNALVIENINYNHTTELDEVSIIITDKLFPVYTYDIISDLGISITSKYILKFNIYEDNIVKMSFDTNFVATNGINLTKNIFNSYDTDFNKSIYNICGTLLSNNKSLINLTGFKVQ